MVGPNALDVDALHTMAKRDDDENTLAYEAAVTSLDAVSGAGDLCSTMQEIRSALQNYIEVVTRWVNKWSWLIPGPIENRLRQLLTIAVKVIVVLDAATNQFCQAQ